MTNTGAGATNSNSTRREVANGIVSAMAPRTASARSMRSCSGGAAPGSLRASASICSTRRVARSMPAPIASRAASRSASLLARRSSSSCSLSAVSGERSSCAASATKARCASSEPRRRASNAFRARASGDSSSGRPPTASGASDCSSRARTSPASRSSGARLRAASHQMPSAASGAIKQQRQDAAPGRAGGEALADLDRLRHLDDAIAGRHAVGAPGAAVDVECRQPEQRTRRQSRMRTRLIEAAAVDAPDLDDEVEPAVGQRVDLRRGDLALVAQRQGHLLQLVVEQRLGLAEHVAVGHDAHRRRGQRQQREQRDQQANADRGHGRTLPPSATTGQQQRACSRRPAALMARRNSRRRARCG